MATPIYKTLAGVVLTLGASAFIVSDAWTQESRRPGGGEGRQFEPGAGPRGAGPGARSGAGSEGRRAGGATTRGMGDSDDGSLADSDGAPESNAMQFDTSPVRAGAGAPVRAAASSAAQSNGWLDEIAEIEARVALLEKREDLDTRLIDSQIRMLEKRTELEILKSEGLEEMMVDAQKTLREKRAELDELMRASTTATLASLPAVVSIIGSQGKYQSQLYFQPGRIVYARVGDLIAPGVRVVDVSPAGVEVSMVLGESTQPQQVPLNFVSLPERRGENEDDLEAALEKTRALRDALRPSGVGMWVPGAGAGAGAAPRPAAARGAN